MIIAEKKWRKDVMYNAGKPTWLRLTFFANLFTLLPLPGNLSLQSSLSLSPTVIPLTFLPEGNGKNVRPESTALTDMQAFHKGRDLVVLRA